MAAWPPSQGDRKGRPYYTTNRPAQPVYSRGRACPCPVGLPPPWTGAQQPLMKRFRSRFWGLPPPWTGARQPLVKRVSWCEWAPKNITAQNERYLNHIWQPIPVSARFAITHPDLTCNPSQGTLYWVRTIGTTEKPVLTRDNPSLL